MAYSKKIPVGRDEEIAQKKRDFHDHNLTRLPNIIETLFTTLEIIEKHHIPYAIIGGIAVKELGRPRVTHDIDLFVKPDDADEILNLLNDHGFEIERRDPFWLYKAWKDEILVDIIFRSCGDIYFEEEVMSHVRRIPYHGHYLNTISPEDFIIIKSAAHQEDNPHHWYDALAVITQGNIDWEYLLRRARHCPRRILSLLIYAQSNDVAVPNDTIQKLYRLIFDHPNFHTNSQIYPYRTNSPKMASPSEKNLSIYTKGKIMEALTNDDRIAEHDIHITVCNNQVLVRGEVFTYDQKNAVEDVILKVAPQMEVKNQLNIRVLTPPEGTEAIS
jgi:predicted nucleotidyltransferase